MRSKVDSCSSKNSQLELRREAEKEVKPVQNSVLPVHACDSQATLWKVGCRKAYVGTIRDDVASRTPISSVTVGADLAAAHTKIKSLGRNS